MYYPDYNPTWPKHRIEVSSSTQMLFFHVSKVTNTAKSDVFITK